MFLFRLIGQLMRYLWRFVDFIRRVFLNALFLLLIAVIAVMIWPSSEPLSGEMTLVLRPEGELVEQAEWSEPFELLLAEEGVPQTRLRDLIEAVDSARDDERINALVIETDSLAQAGFSKLSELRAAIARFKESGKPVLARGERFTQGQYYLASAADEVHMSPDGLLLLRGLSRYATYYKNALDKLGIDVHVFRVGEYKSFSEPFTRTDMSDEDRMSSQDLLNGLWNALRDDILASRGGMTAEMLDRYVLNYDKALAATAGNAAQAAHDAKLVDQLDTRDEWRDYLKERLKTGADGEVSRIGVSRYLAAVRAERKAAADQVAVLVVQGSIVDGRGAPGAVGGDDFSKLIRSVREDDSVKALVVRIDSPGGSAWASEQIRRELEVTRDAGKPVVVSMSSTAASGGYWIAAGADEIWAHPSTVTGSIGIFALVPNLTKPFNDLGLTVDGVSTGPFASALDPRRPLDPEVEKALQLGIEHGYRRFIGIVADARGMPPEEVDMVARGRVWLGTAASELGLVDALGGLNDAIEAAAVHADLTDYEVVWPERSLSPRQMLLKQLSDMTLWAGGGEADEAPRATESAFVHLFDAFRHEAQTLRHWNDPQHLYSHCMCEMP